MSTLPRPADTFQYLLGVLLAMPLSLAGTAMIFLLASGAALV